MGIGDEIMATAEVRRLSESFPEAQIVVSPPAGRRDWSAQQALVFANNPRITPLSRVREDRPVVRVVNRPGQRPYIDRMDPDRIRYAAFRSEPGEIYFDEVESARIERLRERLGAFHLVDPSVKRTMVRRNKDWQFGGALPNRWPALVEACASHTRIVQAGPFGALEPGVVLDVPHVLTRSFRDALCVLAASSGIVCHEGGMHHAAAALGKPAVVIFGGRTSPDCLGYRSHANLFVPDPESPCGATKDCDHCKRCMESITVEQVAAAAASAFGW